MLSEGEPLFFGLLVIFIVLVCLGIAADLGFFGNI